MKTRRSRSKRKCNLCSSPIEKGEQYALKSKRIGDHGMEAFDGTVHEWQPYYHKFPVCAKCAM